VWCIADPFPLADFWAAILLNLSAFQNKMLKNIAIAVKTKIMADCGFVL
jgi:hypothetical protein